MCTAAATTTWLDVHVILCDVFFLFWLFVCLAGLGYLGFVVVFVEGEYIALLHFQFPVFSVWG